MNTYYCRVCAFELGFFPEYNPVPDDLLSREIPFKKYLKHTLPPIRLAGVHSVFNDTSESRYLQFVINTSASGCLEIDEYGRKSQIYAVGERIGCTFVNGELYRPDDAVRLVLPWDADRMHAFSTSGSVIPRLCLRCGNPIVT